MNTLHTRVGTLGIALQLALAAVADGPADNVAAQVRRIPPAGVNVPDAERAALQSGLDTLRAQINALNSDLKTNPELLTLLPDVEVFHKAVRYALEHGEFHKTNEIKSAHALLAEAMQGAEQLAIMSLCKSGKMGMRVRSLIQTCRMRMSGANGRICSSNRKRTCTDVCELMPRLMN